MTCPGQVTKLAGALSCAPKVCRFHRWSGHVWETPDRCFFLSRSQINNNNNNDNKHVLGEDLKNPPILQIMPIIVLKELSSLLFYM